MSVDSNIERIQNIYAAFGRGDVPSIIEAVHPDIDWEWGYRHRDEIPWLRPGRGRAAVVAFFEALRQLRFEVFEVFAVMGQGDWVVALCRLEAVHNPTGRRIVEACEVHVWRFDAEGHIVAFKHAADTLHQAQVVGAV